MSKNTKIDNNKNDKASSEQQQQQQPLVRFGSEFVYVSTAEKPETEEIEEEELVKGVKEVVRERYINNDDCETCLLDILDT